MQSIIIQREDLQERVLEWQAMGLTQTASGYGNKLTTVYKAPYNNRFYRMYAICHSNIGSYFIISKGQQINIIIEG